MIPLRPPFYYGDGYKLCLAVYANGKGAGAGTHVSVELLQMKGEHDDKLRWNSWGIAPLHYVNRLSIQMMPQSKKAQAPEKEVSHHICTNCFTRQPPPEDLRVFKNCWGNAVSVYNFIDHQRAEQVMVLNDTHHLAHLNYTFHCPLVTTLQHLVRGGDMGRDIRVIAIQPIVLTSHS